MKNISVIGQYTTAFGELWEKSLYDMVFEAVEGALQSAKLEKSQVDAVFFGNMLGGILENNVHGGAKISEYFENNIPVFRMEAACASGGIAFHTACLYVQSGAAKTALIVGAEKMTDFPAEHVVAALSAAASGEEQDAGLTFPGLYGIMARAYMNEYGYTEEDLAHVAIKNHFHGSKNAKAQFRNEITLETVMNSPYVASPLKVMDASPISDGASAVVITLDEDLKAHTPHSMQVLASEVATDTLSLSKRASLTSIEATRVAAKKAYKKAGISAKEISVAEVHDCFTIAEIMALEDLGFFEKGKAAKASKNLATHIDFSTTTVVNTSGGLKAAGHPVGATGIKQISEIFQQFSGAADTRLVKNLKYGLTHNVGGSGGTAVVSIFARA